MIDMPHLFGERVRLRAVEKEDITNFLRWVNDPEVTENLTMVSPMSCYEEENWYESMMKQPVHEHVFVIDIQDETQQSGYVAIGNCSFFKIDWRNRSTEIGIMIGEKAYWDKGYGSETMKLMLDHGFATLNLHRIWLRVYKKNKRGIRAYEKAGFQYEGMFRQGHYQHGQYYDVHLMSVLKDEWLARKAINQ